MLSLGILIVLVPMLVVTAITAVIKRDTAKHLVRFGSYLAITQLMAIVWYFISVRSYRRSDYGIQDIVYLIPALTFIIIYCVLRHADAWPNKPARASAGKEPPASEESDARRG